MGIVTEEYSFQSNTGVCDIYVKSWAPEDREEIKAVVQLCHGMAEHVERYNAFAAYLCKNGYAVFAMDMAGHGKSIAGVEELGYFGPKDGYRQLVKDAKTLTDLIKKKMPGKPLFLMGHSMGSFLARNYTSRFGKEIDGAVFCGTAGKNPAVGVAIQLANFIIKQKGGHYRSHFIDQLAFGSFNNKFEKRTKYDWLSRDHQVVDAYIEDPLCGFLFTACGYRDLFRLMDSVSKRAWYDSVPYALPICLIAGDKDPVGNYGKGVREVYQNLKKTGHKTVAMKLYAGGRHEILNETNCESVFQDVVTWLDNTLSGANGAQEA